MNHSLTIVLILFTTILSGCANFTCQQEIREVKDFESIIVGGLADVFITQSEHQQVRVFARGIPIEDVITHSENGTLTVTTQGYHSGESVKVYVTYKQLKNIKTSGSATLTGENQLIAEHVTIVTTGSGDITSLSLAAKQLSVQINDTANANLVVQVENSNIEMNDAGDLDIQGVANHQQLRSNGSRGTLNNTQLKLN
ncbi:GIN domain-containing protein [Pseudoalteromonas luteoviolacea]|uniref:Putative auto-transporter adhesin head GIN domain-containing protein n=1 Tax=Pseudoalteromonas luteoviolacea H33 TaxID=1365251 RepID=A0A167BDF1_9GAMM|nr:DUF2807 domain-containing protein [Pseudoalteromonas luteoviolacea]KZN46412.1 hypothetical protein N476_24570 [Pseudoalteromonas luteoviolacea H33]KZN75531.1 hypothetical protein N477_18705 [Pseudoalteromonas luteoviolacea H33-S]MBQ4875648.1 DUF2807 domain-containing protein [Pseudoalteromonas luteoviolacea]MBQ4904683.1 DUF2807 domain-containing protein [Pseudoalteromonas luteoviolacea]